MQKKITISFLLFNLITSLILLFNNAFFISAFQLSTSFSSIALNISYYFITFSSFVFFNYIISFVFLRKLKIFKSILFVLIFSSFIIGYYSLKYKLNINDIFIINIMNEFSQAKEVISIKDIFIIILFSILILYIFIIFNIEKINFNFRTFIITISIFTITFIIAVFTFKYSYIYTYNYYRGIDSTLRQEIAHKINYYKYFYTIRGVIRYYKNTPSLAEIMATVKQGDVSIKKPNNITTIFIMSDSVRAKSMSLFSHSLNTNPNLQKLYNDKKIYLFKQNSCFLGTFVSLHCMLSLTKAEEFRALPAFNYPKEKITKYFNYLRIDTFYLHNNEVKYFNNGYKYAPYGTDIPSLDSQLLPTFYNIISSKAQFITINFRGAHIPYDLMLEDTFRKFHPDSSNKIDIDYSNYHNKILQVDYIWSNIIEFLSKQNKPIFAILTADHGQSLGEYYNGVQYFVHGADLKVAPPEQKEVPLIVYVNQAYKDLYPVYAKNIAENMKKYKNSLIQSDVISNSLLHCSGIEGKVVDNSLSICGSLVQQQK